MNLQTPQSFYKESLKNTIKHLLQLENCNSDEEAFTYVLKSFCDKYSNVFKFDDDINKAFIQKGKRNKINFFNMYWNGFYLEKLDFIYNTILVSKNAYAELGKCSKECSTNTEFRKKMESALYLEHLTPMSYTYKRAYDLLSKDIDANIDECFKFSVVCLITRDESKKLDSKTEGGLLKIEDLNTLKEIGKKYNGLVTDEIEQCNNLINGDCCLKDNGNGLIRFIHLFNSGIHFINPKNVNNTLSLDDSIKLLLANKFFLNQYK